MSQHDRTGDKTVLPSSDPELVGNDEWPLDARGIALVVLAVLGTILFLQFARPVLLPVIVAVLISYVLAPGVTSLQRYGIPRVLGSILAITLLCGGIGVGVYALNDEVMAIVDDVPAAAKRLAERA
ncbi:MAG: hypothetical protein LC804_25740, partial [Acidobacteria bacterium]|nr:hypothetical protein [Acidobacteriota bacterium]